MPETGPAWPRELLGDPHSTPDKARRVRLMFNAIAPRYQLVNCLFSAGRDAYWRRKAVELANVRPDDLVLDVGCGTGDFARAFAAAGAAHIVGCDFAHVMLTHALRFNPQGPLLGPKPTDSVPPTRTTLSWCEADALHLPFHSATFSIVASAFVVRNFQNLDTGLAEMFRVLRPGGRALILEFTRPRNRLARSLYEFYANRVMPLAATLVARDTSGAYRYLPRSVVSFLDAPQMCAKLRSVGFAPVTATPLTVGIVSAYLAARE